MKNLRLIIGIVVILALVCSPVLAISKADLISQYKSQSSPTIPTVFPADPLNSMSFAETPLNCDPSLFQQYRAPNFTYINTEWGGTIVYTDFATIAFQSTFTPSVKWPYLFYPWVSHQNVNTTTDNDAYTRVDVRTPSQP